MKRIIAVFALILFVVAGAAVLAASVEPIASRQGDNTIYFMWDAKERRIVEASSSRRLTAGQQVDLLTRLTDRSGALVATGVLKNVSSDQRYRAYGRLVQRIFSGSDVVRVRRSKMINKVLAPGDKVARSFTYYLPSGSYSVRTDFVRK